MFHPVRTAFPPSTSSTALVLSFPFPPLPSRPSSTHSFLNWLACLVFQLACLLARSLPSHLSAASFPSHYSCFLVVRIGTGSPCALSSHFNFLPFQVYFRPISPSQLTLITPYRVWHPSGPHGCPDSADCPPARLHCIDRHSRRIASLPLIQALRLLLVLAPSSRSPEPAGALLVHDAPLPGSTFHPPAAAISGPSPSSRSRSRSRTATSYLVSDRPTTRDGRHSQAPDPFSLSRWGLTVHCTYNLVASRPSGGSS